MELFLIYIYFSQPKNRQI